MRDSQSGGFSPEEGLVREDKEKKPGKIYVEIGSGGNPAFFVSKKALNPGDKYFVVDFNPDDHKISNVFGKMHFGEAYEAVFANGKALPFENDSADEIIFSNVFGDPKTFGRDKLLMEAARVLKPDGGQIIITEHITPADFVKEIGGTKEDITQFLSKHGIPLKVKKISREEADAEDYIGQADVRLLKGTPIQVILER